jgi:hypothetical protein
VNEGSCELNQPLVKTIPGTFALCEPEFFQDVVGLVEKLAVKTLKIAEVMRIKALSATALNQGGDLCALIAQSPQGSIASGDWASEKAKFSKISVLLKR